MSVRESQQVSIICDGMIDDGIGCMAESWYYEVEDFDDTEISKQLKKMRKYISKAGWIHVGKGDKDYCRKCAGSAMMDIMAKEIKNEN